MQRDRVGFVGIGNMGGPMAGRLVAAGHDVVIHDATRATARPLVQAGARWADSPRALAAETEVALLSLPGPRQVEAVVVGRDGLLEGFSPGAVIVDLSTNSVDTVRRLAAECSTREVHFLDSPVSGGAAGSAEGTLVLMVGGERQALERVRPVLEVLSRGIEHLGDSGAGTIAKLVNNQLYLCGEVLFYEGLVLAAKAGLDSAALVEILKATRAGGMHAELAGRVLERQFDDTTFALELAEKDVALALEAARSLSVEMPVTAAAHQLFVAARAAGLDRKNFWSAFELLEDRARVRVPSSGHRDLASGRGRGE